MGCGNKRSVFVFSILSLAVFSNFSCGDTAPNLSKQAEIQDRENLLTTLNDIAGKYTGKITDSPDGSEDFPVELYLYVVEEPNGVNEAGELKFRPSLRARYRRLDFPLDGSSDKNLSGRYYQENGVITLFSSGTQTTDSGYISITANYSTGQLTGELRNQQGILGNFVLTRK